MVQKTEIFETRIRFLFTGKEHGQQADYTIDFIHGWLVLWASAEVNYRSCYRLQTYTSSFPDEN
jgi:hypothetical protein